MSIDIDPNRLLVVIKERHTLVERLKKLLAKAIGDNRGDAFKINRLLKYHTKQLRELEERLKDKVAADKVKRDKAHSNWLVEEEAAINRLRIEINNWSLDNGGQK